MTHVTAHPVTLSYCESYKVLFKQCWLWIVVETRLCSLMQGSVG